MFGMKTRGKFMLGLLAAAVYPKLTREVRAGDMGGPKEDLKRLIAHAELGKLHAAGKKTTVQQALTQRWSAENLQSDYYDHYADRFDEMFNGAHARIVDWLKDFAAETQVQKVIEVGCGDGRALEAMSQRVPGIPSWIGVDINADIIARNLENFAGSDKLAFVHADADTWLAQNIEPGTLLMTYGGVMEYISPDALKGWLNLVIEKGGAGILLTEPADPAHDLATDPGSHLWGRESSYSHNHRAMLEAAGFRILESAEAVTWKSNFRWVMMLAEPSSHTD